MPFLCQHYELMCNDRMDDKQYNKYRFINWAIGGEGEEGHNNMEETITAKAWTADEIEDIWHRYQNGETPSALAEAYGKSVGSIKGVIRRRKEKEGKAIQTVENNQPDKGDVETIETVVEIDEYDGNEGTDADETEASEGEGWSDGDEVHRIKRTRVKPIAYRPRRKEPGRLYTGMAFRMRKKR